MFCTVIAKKWLVVINTTVSYLDIESGVSLVMNLFSQQLVSLTSPSRLVQRITKMEQGNTTELISSL